MTAIVGIFCDESGNTGQNLADLSQPVFAIGATVVGRTDAEQLLAPFAVLNQAELKHNKVRKTTKGTKIGEMTGFTHPGFVSKGFAHGRQAVALKGVRNVARVELPEVFAFVFGMMPAPELRDVDQRYVAG